MARDYLEVIKADFLEKVKDHKTEIFHDEGLYRHLHFNNKDQFGYWFDLITWPGCLTIHGDMGTFSFRRINDMFEFFPSSTNEINPQYWEEKLISTSDPTEQFSKEVLIEWLLQWYEINNEDEDYFDDAEEVLHQLDQQFVFKSFSDAEEVSFALNSFSFESNGILQYPFLYDYEVPIKQYSYRYIWNCNAIIWGIGEYYKAKEKQ